MAVGVCAAAVLITGCAGTTSSKKATVTETKMVTITATAGPMGSAAEFTPTYAPTGPANTISSDGTFVVGTDIAPGTYKTAGPSSEPFCIWHRLKDLSGSDDSTIDIGNEPGQAFVTIQPTDAAFKTEWCMPWQKVNWWTGASGSSCG
jgi:hypothetical protein